MEVALFILNTVVKQKSKNKDLGNQCKSKLQWGITSHQLGWTSSENLQTTNAGEGVDKRLVGM